MKKCICSILFLACISSGYAQDVLSFIRPESAYGLCRKMAGEDFAGRYTGAEGYTAAARWAAAQLEQWGLKPAFDNQSYLQPFPAPHSIVDRTSAVLRLSPKDGGWEKEIVWEAGKDFFPLLFTDSGEAEAGVVFVGWGISAPDLGYDDYAGMDVRDKFVLCFRGVPDAANTAYTLHDEHRTRMKTARDKGAKGLIYLYEEVSANPNGDRLPGFLPLTVSYQAGDRILAEKGITSADLRRDLSRYRRSLSFELKAQLQYKVEARHFPEAQGYNIAAYLEGTDPQLRKEWIILGGHYDHCGKHAGMLFPGADDNASGSASVMEAARALATSGFRPRRSVAFVLFGGEEMGLLGSNWFVHKGPYQGGRFAAMINFDMTGAGAGLGCGYSATPAEWKQRIDHIVERLQIPLRSREIRGVGVRGSDFAPFFLSGVPVVSLASNGPHLYYHQQGDTIYRINPDMMAMASRFGLALALDWAEREK